MISHGGLLGTKPPPKQSSKTPKIETWNTINQFSFCQILECQSLPHKAKAPLQKRKAPLLKTFWRRFWIWPALLFSISCARFGMDSNFFGSFLYLLSRYHAWMMASINLFTVVQYNIFNRDFVIDHGISMELRSSEFLGQSNTYSLCFRNIAFTFKKWPFSYLEWLFFQLRQCICLNASYPQLAQVNLFQKS